MAISNAHRLPKEEKVEEPKEEPKKKKEKSE